MTIEEGLYSYLSTFAGIVALISDKIYPISIPQSVELPAIAYTKIAADRPRSAIGGHSGLTVTTFQISVFAETKTEESALTEQLHTALLNYKGLMGAVDVQGCFCLSEINGYDIDKEGTNTKEYYNHIDYQITT